MGAAYRMAGRVVVYWLVWHGRLMSGADSCLVGGGRGHMVGAATAYHVPDPDANQSDEHKRADDASDDSSHWGACG